MADNKRRRIIVEDEVDNDMDDRERFVNVNDEYKRDEDNESVESNPDVYEEEEEEDEGEGEDLAETWDKYVFHKIHFTVLPSHKIITCYCVFPFL